MMDSQTHFKFHITTQPIVSNIQSAGCQRHVSLMTKQNHTRQHDAHAINMEKSILAGKISVMRLGIHLPAKPEKCDTEIFSNTRTTAKIDHDSALTPGHGTEEWPLRENQFLGNQESKYAK